MQHAMFLRPASSLRSFVLPVLLCLAWAGLLAQDDAVAQLTAEQRDQYTSAVQLFNADHFADSLAIFRKLLAQLPSGTPGQVLIAKYTADASINTGDRDAALPLLKPIAAADANDWQAAGMLARIYAETGQKQLRDAQLAHLVDLHTRAVSPQIARMQQIMLEKIPLPSGFIRVFYSLEPWSRYKIYLMSRVFNPSGQQVFRISLESSDFDQPAFVKEHPDLAAQGQRRFSLDGYGPDQKLPNGQTTQSHMTFGFFDGKPAYDIVRERVVNIALGKERPLTRGGPRLAK